ncbi:hypothetical protein KAT67_02070 [candidate division WOR-3 bacterium]|jgi:hypothetical protein|nr:hypothetical protein [candidate division WOR-3 bacterium]
MKNLAFKTFLITFICFGGLYILLVFSSRYSQISYHIIGTLLAVFSIFAFVMTELQKEKPVITNQWGILCGLALWGFLGEYLEHLEWLDIASWHYLPALLILTFFTILLLKKEYLPIRFGFAFGHFLGIWALHMLMITQFELLGRTHWITYPTAVFIGIFALFSYIKIRRVKSIDQKMAWSLVLLLTSWTVLEYIWAWRLIPGPYSIS